MTWTIILGVRVRGSLADNADPISTLVEGDHTASEAEAIARERATALGWEVIGVETSIYSQETTMTTDPLAALCAEYDAWNKRNHLNLGSADEHLFDPELTDDQRAWLREFSDRWEDAIAAEEDARAARKGPAVEEDEARAPALVPLSRESLDAVKDLVQGRLDEIGFRLESGDDLPDRPALQSEADVLLRAWNELENVNP